MGNSNLKKKKKKETSYIDKGFEFIFTGKR